MKSKTFLTNFWTCETSESQYAFHAKVPKTRVFLKLISVFDPFSYMKNNVGVFVSDGSF